MSAFFAYICTSTSADPRIPSMSPDIRVLSRDVSDAFIAISGGSRQVGQLAFFPVQRAVANHLLCNGQEVPKVSFPELYEYLGDTQGAPLSAANFVLPDYVADFVPATTVEPEMVENGTVTTPTIPGNYTRADSGGRIPRMLEDYE